MSSLASAWAGDCKETIAQLLTQLEIPASNQSELKKKLAEAYLRDQNQKEAISSFLEAVAELPLAKKNEEMSWEECKIFTPAFAEYLEHKGQSITQASKKILKDYAPVIEENPQYYHLTYLVALAYANLGLFEPFFKLFYAAYAELPTYYLAEKTKAVLHIKLLERVYEEEGRMKERQKIATHLQNAIRQFPQDTTLYKMRISFAAEKEQPLVLEECIQKIIQENYQIPRHDIAFYIQAAIVQNKNSLAQLFIEKAKEWYPYSRTLMRLIHAHKLLEQQKGKK